MTQQVTLEDGSIHQFPDDATPDEMQSALPPPKVSGGSSEMPGEEAFRQVGLAGRDLAGAIPLAFAGTGDMINKAINSVAGTHLGMPSEYVNEGLDKIFPKPQNAVERAIPVGTSIAFGGGEQGVNALKEMAGNAGEMALNTAKAPVNAASDLWSGVTARSPEEMQAEAETLKRSAGNAYQDIGSVIFNPDKTSDILSDVNKATTDPKFIPQLNPKTSAIVQHMNDMAEQNDGQLSLDQLDQYRRLLGRVGPTEDGVSAGAVKRILDSHVTNAGAEDLAAGDTNTIKQLNIGRQNYANASRYEDISDILSKANGNPNRIKAGLSRFAADPDNYKGWSKDQVAALKDAADTGLGENLLKSIGKFGFSFDKPGVGNTALPALATGVGVFGHQPWGVPLAAAGTLARMGQTYLARGKADQLLNLLAQTKPYAKGGLSKPLRALPRHILPEDHPVRWGGRA
jgi:hypothetical protein